MRIELVVVLLVASCLTYGAVVGYGEGVLAGQASCLIEE